MQAKARYESLEVEVIRFEDVDVITTSDENETTVIDMQSIRTPDVSIF